MITNLILSSLWGFPKIKGTFLGVPIVRTVVLWGLYWGPLILGNYHLKSPFRSYTRNLGPEFWQLFRPSAKTKNAVQQQPSNIFTANSQLR